MRGDGGGQVDERVELLELAGARDGEQALDGAFAGLTSCPEHDFPPLHGRSQCALGGIVRGRHAVVIHEREEMLALPEQGPREVADRRAGMIDVAIAEPKERAFDRLHLGDELGPRERRTAGAGVAAKAVPEPKQPAVEDERCPAEAPRRGRRRQVERTQKVSGEMGLMPTWA